MIVSRREAGRAFFRPARVSDTYTIHPHPECSLAHLYHLTERAMVDGPKPRPLSGFFLLGVLVPIAFWFIIRPFLDPVPPVPALYTSLGFSILAFVTTLYLVPSLGPAFIQANLKGRDLLKVYSTPMYVPRRYRRFVILTVFLSSPESQGLVCASVYILSLILFIPFAFSNVFADRLKNQQKSVHGLAIDEFPHHQVRFLSNVSRFSPYSGS